jgi:trans-2-enoyl-CoA reductase
VSSDGERGPSRLCFHEFGVPAEVLRLEAFEPRPPQSGEALVRVLAAPIHPADLNFIEGSYGIRPVLPAVPGGEGCGEVIESAVPGLRAGDRVVFLHRTGTWATHVTTAAGDLLRIGADSDILQAAMLKVNPVTAWCLLNHFAELHPGDWVVQNLGNSAVGRCVIQLARDAGVRTISFVRSQEQVAGLTDLGAEAVFVDGEEGMRAAMDRMGGAEARLAFNAVGGESVLRLIRQLAESGTLVTYGAMARKPVTVPNSPLIFRDIRIRGLWVTRWLEQTDPRKVREVHELLGEKVRAGRLLQPVDSVHPLRGWRAALARLSAADRSGKVLFGPCTVP